MQPKTFCQYMNFYWHEFGWKTVPITAKTYLIKSKVPLEGIGFFTNPIPQISWTDVDSTDWMEDCSRFAHEYESNLTGIGLLLAPSDMCVIDVDLLPSHENCPVVKTGRGYHILFRTNPPFWKDVLLEWGSYRGCGISVLPPSEHYETRHQFDEYHVWSSGLSYKWHFEPKIPIPTVDPYEIGWISSRLKNHIDHLADWKSHEIDDESRIFL